LRQCHIWDRHNRNDIVTVSKVQDRARSGSRRMRSYEPGLGSQSIRLLRQVMVRMILVY
jgi:hypothetical protein